MSALRWTPHPPSSFGYYWLRTAGYERGIIVWVHIGAQGQFVVDRPLGRNVADVDGLWAGPIPEPEEEP